MRTEDRAPEPSELDDQPQRETHRSHTSDWRWADAWSPNACVYIGRTTGWYIAPPCEPEWEEVYEKPVVYFIHAPELKRVKIGRSVDPLKRLANMQIGSPERLVLVRVLPEAGEHEMHARFASKRLHGEWFEDSILDEIPED